MQRNLARFTMALIVVVAAMLAIPADAATVPSKTAPDQSLTERQADLVRIQDFVEIDQVAAILEQHGFTQDEVNQRLAALSDEEISSFANNLDQIQAAGITSSQWTYILIGAVAVLLIVVLV